MSPHVLEHLENGELSAWRDFLLHNKALHLIIIVLLFVDGLICLVSGVLEKQYYDGKANDCINFATTCKSHRRLSDLLDPLGLRPEADLSPAFEFMGFLDEEGNSSQRRLSSGSIDCNGHPHFGNHDLHDIEMVLAYISMSILIFFLMEQIALIFELKCDYWRQPLFVLDLLVITSSLGIEVAVTIYHKNQGKPTLSILGLMVVARMWRFARIGHGVFEAANVYEESFVPEDDETVDNMAQCWAKISDARWDEITKSISAADLMDTLTEEEKNLAEMLGRNSAVALRALAYAQAYKKKMDKKVLRDKHTSEPHRQMSHACEKSEPQNDKTTTPTAASSSFV